MKIKDLLLPLSLALVSTWAINYFFLPKPQATQEGKSGTEFIAPATPHVARPLDVEIDFVDTKPTREKQITKVETPHAIWEFSSDGAIVERLSYKRRLNNRDELLTPLQASDAKDHGGFLLALNDLGLTPYYYDLIEQKKEDGKSVISYRAETPTSTITKIFTVYDTNYKLDLVIQIEPKGNDELLLRPRIFFKAPFIIDSSAADSVRGVVYTDKLKLVKKSVQEVVQHGWEKPELFGVEDRYFTFMLIQDPQQFTQRAYFKVEGTDKLTVILEGPAIKEKSAWNLSFYCGPKETAALAQVDPRLEGLLDYGVLAFICKPVMWLLNFFYSFLKNYGLAILLLTLLIKLIMVPLGFKGEKAARQGAEIQRKFQYLEQKYRNDPEALAREKTEIMRKHGPSLLGCLPLLLQIPIFIALNKALSTSIELYKAPFLWISDLSSKDPYYILPILIGVGVALQTAQTGNARQRLSSLIMALVVAAISSSLAAGLSLYIATSQLLTVAQSRIQKALGL